MVTTCGGESLIVFFLGFRVNLHITVNTSCSEHALFWRRQRGRQALSCLSLAFTLTMKRGALRADSTNDNSTSEVEEE